MRCASNVHDDEAVPDPFPAPGTPRRQVLPPHPLYVCVGHRSAFHPSSKLAVDDMEQNLRNRIVNEPPRESMLRCLVALEAQHLDLDC
jgi:hypothetical protein